METAKKTQLSSCSVVCNLAESSSPPLHGLGCSVLESIQDKDLEQLLVRDTDFHWLAGGTVLPIPGLHQRDVNGTT